jgi:predicted ATP-grasp superfamily ATP-dependent carboligase
VSASIQTVTTPEIVRAATETVGAVVLGGDYQGLGIVRSLGRQGVPVCVVDDEYSISRFSRYATRFVNVPDLRDQRKVVDCLLEMGKRLGLEGWILYPTREEIVAALSHNRTELSRVFRVPTADWESVKWAWDKRNTYQLAQQLDIPTPVTHYPENVDQLAQLDNVSPPFAVKPAIKEHFFYATKAKAWCAHNHSELRTLFQKASELTGNGEIMVQELIPGGGSQQFSYCAFFRNGEAVGKMVVRRTRQHPLQFGRASTYVETVDVPILEELSERFLRAMDYYGLIELEYKLDPRDCQYKLLDVNARTWGYHSLGARAGVDFSYMLYSDQVGLPVSPSKARTGVAWVRTTTDLPAAMLSILSGNTSWRSYLRSLRDCNVEAVFSAEDPLPGVAEVALIPYLAIKRGF